MIYNRFVFLIWPVMMDTTNQYYNPVLYRNDFNQLPTMSAASYPQTCLYGTPKMQTMAAYGAQNMNVVESHHAHLQQTHGAAQAHCVGMGVNSEASGGLGTPPYHPPSCMGMTSPAPAHMPLHQNNSHTGATHGTHPGTHPPGLPSSDRHHHHGQPPPAHQNAGKTPSGGKDVDEQSLQFTWMRRTKSHAHQWKANWAGKYLNKNLQSDRQTYIIMT